MSGTIDLRTPFNLRFIWERGRANLLMTKAFDVLKQFFVGASYSVFAVGCVLAIISETFTYLTFVGAFIFALLLLILGWVCALAEEG